MPPKPPAPDLSTPVLDTAASSWKLYIQPGYGSVTTLRCYACKQAVLALTDKLGIPYTMPLDNYIVSVKAHLVNAHHYHRDGSLEESSVHSALTPVNRSLRLHGKVVVWILFKAA